MTAPFLNCGIGEVLARVSIAYVKKMRKRVNCAVLSPAEQVRAIINLTPPDMDTLLLALESLCFHLAIERMSSGDWAKMVAQRSRYGYDMRRSLYPPYKANRDYPRVTNRGVVKRPSSKDSER